MQLVVTYAFQPSECPFTRNRIDEITDRHHQWVVERQVKTSNCWQSASWEPGDKPNTIVVTVNVTSVDKFLGIDGLLTYSVWDEGSECVGEFIDYRMTRVVIEDP